MENEENDHQVLQDLHHHLLGHQDLQGLPVGISSISSIFSVSLNLSLLVRLSVSVNPNLSVFFLSLSPTLTRLFLCVRIYLSIYLSVSIALLLTSTRHLIFVS